MCNSETWSEVVYDDFDFMVAMVGVAMNALTRTRGIVLVPHKMVHFVREKMAFRNNVIVCCCSLLWHSTTFAPVKVKVLLRSLLLVHSYSKSPYLLCSKPSACVWLR